MNVYLTLDYELFLGENTGTVERCLVATMARLDSVARAAGARFTIFADATYLLSLKHLAPQNEVLAADYAKVCSELKKLSQAGHDIQLHIHPQWEYSEFVDGRWVLDQTHYKITDIDKAVALRLFTEGAALLEEICGKRPVGFRAGGFSAQPTALLNELLAAAGIRIDSSVYAGNAYHSPQQDYDYRTAPCGRTYRFSSDINVPVTDGKLTELPISYHPVSPLFYWRLVAQRLSKRRCHRRLGDGVSVKTTGSSIRERLTHRTNGFATIDESKISYLWEAYKAAKRRGDTDFCVIGHPKLATEYSLKTLEKVLGRMEADGAVFKTLSQI